MMAEEVIPPLLSVEEANAPDEEVIPPLLSVEEAISPDEPDSGCVEKQEEQMGIFQTLDRLEEAVDALLNTKSSASSSTLHFATPF
jgi:hypothetical protein